MARNAPALIIVWVAVFAVLDLLIGLRGNQSLAVVAGSFYVAVTVWLGLGIWLRRRGHAGWGGLFFLLGGLALLTVTTAVAFTALDPVALAVGLPAGAAAVPLGALDVMRSGLTRAQHRGAAATPSPRAN